MIVMKFGGTSIANAECFLNIVKILECNIQHEQVAIVVSAPNKVTNNLVSIIENSINKKDISSHINETISIFINILQRLSQIQIEFNLNKLKNYIELEFTKLKYKLYGIALLKQCPDNTYANIISLGEKLSSIIMEELLRVRGHKITVIDPVKNLLAIGEYLESTIDIAQSIIRIKANKIPIDNIILMPGFIAGNKIGELVILGRNGSDYSAAVLSVCLNANRCEIWTDVDGIYTCDPRQVPDAKLLKFISYKEAMELSYFGAKVLHPRTISPIAQFQIPCLIKNTSNPKLHGTLISNITIQKNKPVKGITYLNNIVMFNISGSGIKEITGITSRIFQILSCNKISIILITQSSSEYSISFCVSKNKKMHVNSILKKEFYLEFKNGLLNPLDLIENLAIISVIGDGMRKLTGISAKIFLALASVNINIIAIAQGASERSISMVIKNNSVTIGIRAVHQMLFSTHQIIEVFLIGVGGVGSALLNQINRQFLWLKQKNIELRVCGIANSQSFLIDLNGINLDMWSNVLNTVNKRFYIKDITNLIKKHYLINPVIVDCTSSEYIANQYTEFLSCGFHVVTPNKKANTSSWMYYKKIRVTATKSRRKFLYETNVGAGLPVIENLQNLLDAGDEIIKFSGILSGSLSFIFGKIDEGISLSKATKMACEMGFTEPDPRDDLSGIDVARKLLILAREIGYKIDLKDISIESIIPNFMNEIKDLDIFMEKLKELDNEFATRSKIANNEGKVLRYIGVINDQGICKVHIGKVNSDHAFYKVKNGENALEFYSRYYQPIPLVLRGYGAGNNVTAAGIFADLLRILT